ncbi:hypothetical protein QR680_007513 [Steinernema hermaphroditum]|uniref:SH3 domain-containing protein n=1 Tax=Steinernema hermaphroditum TaxID=289476 RepID=A0AA39M5H7_9BILA|nr:hypothetical protein QR680_007513 [Steinernema hermaphroditum]
MATERPLLVEEEAVDVGKEPFMQVVDSIVDDDGDAQPPSIAFRSSGGLELQAVLRWFKTGQRRRLLVEPEPGQRKWLPAKKVPNFPRGTEAEVFKAFQATAADEVTVPAGSLVTALYRDEQWIYVERADGRKEKFLESLPKDEDGELFVKEPSGEREILYSFQARTEDELSVEKGQLLTILNTTDPNWTWAVDIHGREGFVPANFFSPYDPCEQDDSDLDTMLDFVVVQDFQALSEVDMSVRKGDRLKAPYESVHGWIWAEQTSDRVQGFVPACVTLLATEF